MRTTIMGLIGPSLAHPCASPHTVDAAGAADWRAVRLHCGEGAADGGVSGFVGMHGGKVADGGASRGDCCY